MKIRQVGAQLFHAKRRKDERTNITKLLIAPRKFAKAPKNPCYIAGKQTMPDVTQLPLNCLRPRVH